MIDGELSVAICSREDFDGSGADDGALALPVDP